MKKGFEFFKIEAGGNDFVTVFNFDGSFDGGDFPALARRLCSREKGIGGDGIIIVTKTKTADLKMVYHNSDGSHAALCGNGLRALGLLAYREGLTGTKLSIETDAGVFRLEATSENTVLHNFNPPEIKKEKMTLKIEDKAFTGSFVDVGIPFFCAMLNDSEELDEIDINKYGSAIRNHPDFKPEGTNVTFISVITPNKIRIRIFERGIEGETLSSGTGSYSSAVACAVAGVAESPITVATPGGESVVGFDYENGKFSNPWLEGPANIVFRGKLIDL